MLIFHDIKGDDDHGTGDKADNSGGLFSGDAHDTHDDHAHRVLQVNLLSGNDGARPTRSSPSPHPPL